MSKKTSKGKQAKSGDKFGKVGYWINKDRTHPSPILYVLDPDDVVPEITTKLVFIYFGKHQPTPLEISTLIANSSSLT